MAFRVSLSRAGTKRAPFRRRRLVWKSRMGSSSAFSATAIAGASAVHSPSRCRAFATLAEIDFDEGNGPLTEPRIVRERRRLEQRMIEMHADAEELGEAARPKPGERVGQLPPDLEPSVTDPEVVANGAQLRKKMQRLSMSANPSVRLAIETITLLFALRADEDDARVFAGCPWRSRRSAIGCQRFRQGGAARARADGTGMARH